MTNNQEENTRNHTSNQGELLVILGGLTAVAAAWNESKSLNENREGVERLTLTATAAAPAAAAQQSDVDAMEIDGGEGEEGGRSQRGRLMVITVGARLLEELGKLEALLVVIAPSLNNVAAASSTLHDRRKIEELLLFILMGNGNTTSQRAIQVEPVESSEVLERVIVLLHLLGGYVSIIDSNILENALASGNDELILIGLKSLQRRLEPTITGVVDNNGNSSPLTSILSIALFSKAGINGISNDDTASLRVLEKICSLLASHTELIVQESHATLLKYSSYLIANDENLQSFMNWTSNQLPPFYDDERVSLRAYDLVAALATQSPLSLQCAEMAGLLSFALDFTAPTSSRSGGDTLECLALIELFSQLSQKNEGCNLLQRTNVMQKLADLLVPMHGGDHYILQTTIKFWGMFGFYQSEMMTLIQEELGIFANLRIMFSGGNVGQDDDDFGDLVREAIVVCVGNIGSTPQGLVLLHEERSLLDAILEFLPRANGSLKITALRTLSCLLAHSDSSTCNQISHYIYKSFAGPSRTNPLERLIGLAKSSIIEISVGAYSALKNIAGFSWGLDAFSEQQDTMTFLMERRTDTPSLIKEWKYALIQAMALDSRSQFKFAPSLFKTITSFAKEGPWKTEYSPVVDFATH